MMEMQLEELYESYFGTLPCRIERLKASGSSRIYYRLYAEDGDSVIGTIGDVAAENRAFVEIARHLRSYNIPVPRIYAVSADNMVYLQQDLGDDTLFNHLDDIELLKKTIAYLPEMQFAEGLDYSICYPQSSFDERNVSFDLNYFKYNFLKLTNLPFDEIALETDFERMKENLLNAPVWGFMYRDFQSRNVMLSPDGCPFFIDFQGGRHGPIEYDVASFIWQARAAFPENVKEKLLEAYLDSLEEFVQIDRTEFQETLKHFVLFRMLQTLGAYGYRGLFQRKPHFLNSLPFALKNLSEFIEAPLKDYPYLMQILGEVASLDFGISQPSANEGLTIEVNSFSYRAGIPEDYSGNGGGFVFDCRALENPGRYTEYASLTGRDKEVIQYLEDEAGITEWLENIYMLADRHVSTFLNRGFSHAVFSFGCTGGRHRSVYCAEHLAQHIVSRFDVHVVLSHRALGIREEI
ncbi:MAG: phosphotransferase [Bacteroidales bacterium]|nr:phosphotransferase [Bacteroidales bacterium]